MKKEKITEKRHDVSKSAHKQRTLKAIVTVSVIVILNL